MKGTLFIVSGPSGAGKSTFINKILSEKSNYLFSISHTTRAPRGNERDGVEYFFVNKETFLSMVDKNQFLEYANVHDCYYGTSSKFIIQNLEKGCNVIIDIDFQGAKIIKDKLKDSDYKIISIFVMPSDYSSLKSRLINRDTDSYDVIKKRLNNAIIEIENFTFYDYTIINKDITTAYSDFESIFRANQLTTPNMEQQALNIIKNYKDKLEGEKNGKSHN